MKALATWLITVSTCLHVFAQDTEPFTIERAIQQAIEHNAGIQAASEELNQVKARLTGIKAGFNPELEIAPGMGFTNSNAFISQQIDISGVRSIQVRAAHAEVLVAQARLDLARLTIAAEVARAFYDLIRAREVLSLTEEEAKVVTRMTFATSKRVESGDAPAAQKTRAEIELARVKQRVAQAQAEATAAQTVLNSLLANPLQVTITLTGSLNTTLYQESAHVLDSALKSRPEMRQAEAKIGAAKAELDLAKSRSRPSLFADLTTDAWSLNRRSFQSDRFGFQVRLTLPLLDRGQLRSEERAAQAHLAQQEAQRKETERQILSEVYRKQTLFTSARMVADEYGRDVVPRALSLLESNQKGYEAGLISFLEVLDTQRAVASIRTEALEALFKAKQAEIALLQAIGSMPGLQPQDNSTGGQ
ncbi:MAG: TolC family protein [Fimbriimonadia bacterium]|nr:TolC family protein [Fimbriimonadia bacterium]